MTTPNNHKRPAPTMAENPAKKLKPSTMDLKVTIPQAVVPDSAVTRARKAAATRFKSKLANPFPDEKEIRKAYPLKLLRHYSGDSPDALVTSVKTAAQPSTRVTELLRAFPKAERYKPDPKVTSIYKDEKAVLARNKDATASEAALKQALKLFAFPEECKQKTTRNAMRESGLDGEALMDETRGYPNTLPAWKKTRTGKFAGSMEEFLAEEAEKAKQRRREDRAREVGALKAARKAKEEKAPQKKGNAGA